MTKRTVAAFDFDGTITYRDSLLPFLFFTHGYLLASFYLLIELPWLLGFLFGFASRQSAKEKLLTRFYKGTPIAAMQEYGKRYSETLLKKQVRPEALKRIAWHHREGHEVILISASIDIYLYPWAEKQRLSYAITSRMATDGDGKVTGTLIGANCWGPEKLRRLIEAAGPREDYILYAYGDSRGDQELLDSADFSYYKKLK